MRIAFCDDDHAFMAMAKTDLEQYLLNGNIRAQLQTYTAGAAFQAAHKETPFDLVLLDIDMPTINGFQIAEALRANSPRTELIFVSSMEDFVFRSLNFHPFHFIRKAQWDKEFPAVLDSYFQMVHRSNTSLCIKAGRKQTKIIKSQILYVESVHNNLELHLIQGDPIVFRGKISDLERDLPSPEFLRIHRGYLVRAAAIENITHAGVLLENGAILPISKNKFGEIVTQYQTYIRRGL